MFTFMIRRVALWSVEARMMSDSEFLWEFAIVKMIHLEKRIRTVERFYCSREPMQIL